MNTFTFNKPTKIFFGENAIQNLETQLLTYGDNVLITYGGGSIKENGIYDAVINILKSAKKNVFELNGIMPNPRTEKVYEGIKICKENNIDFILAIGGGSVIDCSKFIAAGAKTERDFWESFFINWEQCNDALPLGVILTLAATGSEMNEGGVITNWEQNIKASYGSHVLHPQFSILDPTYTYTVPKNQMIYGAIDTISHVFESYFSKPDESNLSDDIAEAIIRNVIENIEVALKDPTNYVARSNLMWDSTMALNGIIELGKQGDWMTHQIEHALSAFYDIPHGAGLAIVHPNYLKYVYKNAPKKFVRYAKNIWNVDVNGKTDDEIAMEGIEKTQAFFKEIGAPTTLQEVNIPSSSIEEIASKTNIFGTSYYENMSKQDVINILTMCIGE